MDRPWKAILAFVGVFIAGAVFGGFFTMRSAGKWLTAARSRPTPVPVAKSVAVKSPTGKDAPPAGRIYPQVMRQFTQRLSPTPEQQKAIRPIVSRAAEDLQRMQRDHLADTTRTSERMYADVAAILTPVQRIKLEQMRQEMLERVRREREKRGEVAPSTEVMAKPGSRSGSPSRAEKGAKKKTPAGVP
jgi:Spy/CpxP family protein refolding chaperone